MKNSLQFDVIIVGGSYSGLAAGLALGRALRKVLIIDSGAPCNKQTPHSHNFLTQDGYTPKQIATIAREQVRAYSSISFLDGLVVGGHQLDNGFDVITDRGVVYSARKLIFATGVKDIMPAIPGFAACWGISVLHCPYCHGYEVRGRKTGILANGDLGYEFVSLISNWSSDLTLYTNGSSTLSPDHQIKLDRRNIRVVEDNIRELGHRDGYLQHILFENGASAKVDAIYTRPLFSQHCELPGLLGCGLNPDGFIVVDAMQRTTVPGVYACGDNTSRLRTVANAVSSGTFAGMVVNRELIDEDF